jgi:FMN phosphatase YigB (HAD superfamily)
MKISTVIFDLDNTLVNRKLAFEEFSNRLIDKYITNTAPSERNEIIHYIREADRMVIEARKNCIKSFLGNSDGKKKRALMSFLNFGFRNSSSALF